MLISKHEDAMDAPEHRASEPSSSESGAEVAELSLEGFRLSPQQERLWGLQDCNTGYGAVLVLELDTGVEPRRMARALRSSVRRHDVLRTAFAGTGEGEMPLQVVTEEDAVLWQVLDVRRLGEGRQREVLRHLVQRESQVTATRPGSPTVHCWWVLTAAAPLLLVAAPSLCLDARSLELLFQELVEGYVSPRQWAPHERPMPYAQYSEWQQQLLELDETAEEREFWRSRDYEALLALALPFERPRRARLMGPMEEVGETLTEDQERGLLALGRSLGLSSPELVLAVWLVQLAHLSGGGAVGLARQSQGRPYEELAQALGLFEKYLPLQVRVSAKQSFRAFVDDVRIEIEEAEGWLEYFDWGQVLPRGGGSRPLPVGFETVHRPQQLQSEGQSFRVQHHEAVTERCQLTLRVTEGGGPPRLTARFDPWLFSRPDLERMLAGLVAGIDSVLAEPVAPTGALSFLPAGQRQQVLQGFQPAPRYYPGEPLVHRHIDARCALQPERPALIAGDVTRSYGELAAESNRVARRLRHLGAGPETLVGVFMERSAELVAVLLGVLKAGAAYLPLDPDYPADRLQLMVEDSGIEILVCGPGLAATAPDGPSKVVALEARTGPQGELLPEESSDPLPPSPTSPDLAYAIYTSGSTGRPKAALNGHRSLYNRLLWMQERFALTADEAVLHKTPFSFDVSVWELLWPLLVGARLVLARPGGQREPNYLIELIESQRISTVHFVPAMLRVFLQNPESRRCLGLRRILASGETLSPDLAELARRRLPDTALFNLYGPTECAIDVTCAAYRPVADEEAVSLLPVPIGTPVTNVQIYLLDGRGRPVPVGVAGELFIGGVAVGRGYLGRPALTAGSFVPDPFGGAFGGRLYRTGDAARWLADGALEFIGRLDQQVKIRGFRVEPGELESALVEHSQVSEAAVVVREDLPGYPRLVAYVAPNPDSPDGDGTGTGSGGWHRGGVEGLLDSLRGFLGQRLPAHLMPSTTLVLEELPLLPNGKVDRAALPTPAPPAGAGGTSAEHPAEEILLEIWHRVLGVEGIGLDDDFLALGGDSILSMQVATYANQAGLSLRPAQVFEHPTVRRLARVVIRNPELALEEQRSVSGAVRLTPVQKWFLELDLPRPEHWNQALMMHAESYLDSAALRRALIGLVRHHDSLRSRFVGDGPAWEQQVAEIGPEDPLVTVDLGALSVDDARRQRQELAARLQASLDLERGPLFRAAWMPGPEVTEHRLLMVAHHLVVDGVSWRILLADLEVAYRQALACSETLRMPPKTASFQTWSEHLYRRAQSQDVIQQLDYWLALPWSEVGRLPLDVPGGAGGNLVATEELLSRSLDEKLTSDLLQRSSQAYRTEVGDLLITALVRSISRWTGSASVPVMLEGHGREDRDGPTVHRTVGWFTSLYPVVFNFGQGAGPGDAVVAVKEQLRQLPQRGLGYGLLRYLNSQGDSVSRLRALPRPEISFNYLGQFDSVLADSELLQPVDESPGPLRAPEGPRPFLVEVNAWVIHGRLEMVWSFSPAVHHRETIDDLADHCLEALKALIEHCLSPEASGCTVSDFPMAELSTEELDRLVEQVGDGAVIQDIYPLSPSQEGMLMYLELQGHESGVFFNQLYCELRGHLDSHAFQRCWQQVMDRHPSLRTQFSWRRLRRPLQVVRERVEPPWTLEDWRGITPAALEHRLATYLEQDREQGFDLERPPLVRFALFQVDAAAYRFVLSYHHLVLDGWSLSLMFREALKAYRASLQGQRLSLGEAPAYADYLRWLQEQDPVKAEVFWRRRLNGLRTPTRLPGDRARTAAAPIHDRCQCRISSSETARLASVSRQLMLTQNTLIQGAWALLLHEQSGQDEVVFGNVVSGREGGFENTLGLFINALPVRTRLPWDRSMTSWLQQMQREQVEARQFEFCALEQIQRWSEVPWGDALFETLVIFENYPVEGGLLEGRHGIEVLSVHAEERSNYPLSLFVFPGDELVLELSFDSSRLDRPRAEQLLARLELLLQRMLAAPHTTPAGPLALTASERRQVVERSNDTAKDWEGREPVHRLMSLWAAEHPDAAAVTSRRGVRLTYGELDRRSGQMAAELQRRGIGPGSVVALWMERSPEQLVALYGVLKAGAAYLPVDLLIPRRRVRRQLVAAGVQLLLTRSNLVEGGVPGEVEALCLDTEWPRITALEPAPPRPLPTLSARAYLVATSGSTGTPRVVMVDHRSLLNHTRWAMAEMELQPTDKVLQFSSLAFDASVEEIFPALAVGASVVLREDEMITSLRSFLHACEALEVTVLDLPTSFWHRLVLDSEGAVVLPNRLRLMVVGGERLEPYVLEQWRQRFGPPIRLLNTYGPTEATVVATSAELGAFGQGLPEVEVELPAPPEVTIGTPIPNVTTYVLDRHGRAVPPGVPGELCLGGTGVAQGYRDRPADTAARFVPSPFGEEAGARLLRTGDLACWQKDGSLCFLGRKDGQIKVEGYRVEPGEIEAHLMAQPEVSEAVVTAIATGTQQGRLAAYLSLADGHAAPTPEVLRAKLRGELPEYMVPAVFTVLGSLPRGPGGKVDRSALPAPETGALPPARTYVAPRNETERKIAELFGELLGVPRVGAFDGFFDLGGHSLLATRLVAQVRQSFGVDLPLRQVFETPSVARLAAVVVSLILDRLEEIPDSSSRSAAGGP
ncbi:MAG: amino acid adenylation domain-containing protein [Acidobacteriota bacterium]|nr:amino acid adenylation domain-containing protein [Acidobacteriota bacterium]